MDIYNKPTDSKRYVSFTTKPTDSKRYVSFTSNHSQDCLTNIPFSLARRICTTIVENEKVKEKRFKELRNNIVKTKKS